MDLPSMEHSGLLQRGKIDPAWPASLALHLAVIAILLAFCPTWCRSELRRRTVSMSRW
jgi:hypothetical protein